MNKMMTRFLIPVLFLALSACGGKGGPADPATAPLAGAKMGGSFSLTDQDGRTVTDQAFKGKYRMVYFGYTYCPDVCPVDVQVLSQGLAKFEKLDKDRAAKVVPIFISIDPKRDTPSVVKSFVANFHPRLVGLTGSPADVARIAKEHGIYFELEKPNAEGGYLVNHSNFPVLYDPDGKPLAPLPHDKGADAVVAELARWVR
jgi:protein SCO1